MMEVVMKIEEDDPTRQFEERSVNAAIAALLDEYEPFDVLEGDPGSGDADNFKFYWHLDRSKGDNHHSI